MRLALCALWCTCTAFILLQTPPVVGLVTATFGRAHVKYETPGTTNANSNQFLINVPFQVEYVGEVYSSTRTDWNDYVSLKPIAGTWSTNDTSCSVTSISSTSASVICTTVGAKLLTVTRTSLGNISDSFYVTVKRSNACYDWAVTTSPVQVYGLPQNAPVRLYIQVSASFKNSTIAMDQATTTLYRNLGEEPQVSFASPGYEVFTTAEITNVSDNSGFPFHGVYAQSAVSFDPVLKQWWIDILPTQPGTVNLNVYGKDVSVHGCTVRPVTIPLSVAKYNKTMDGSTVISASTMSSSHAFMYTDLSTTLNNNETVAPNIVRDSCAVNVAAVPFANDAAILFTETGFQRSQVVNYSTQNIGTIYDLAFTNRSLVIVTSKGVFVDLASSTNVLTQATGLPANYCDSVRGLGSCIHLRTEANETSPENDYVTAWRSTAQNLSDGFPVVCLSKDGGLTFQNITVPHSFGALTRIHDVRLVLNQDRLVVFGSTTGEDLVLYASIRRVLSGTASWTRGAVFGPLRITDTNGRASATQSRASSAELFFFGTQFAFSPDGGSSAQILTFRTRDPMVGPTSLTALKNGERVIQVDVNEAGYISCLTSNGRQFYGAVGLGYLFELSTSVSTTTSPSIAAVFARTPGLQLLLSPSSTLDLTSYLIPFANEIESPVYPEPSNGDLSVHCPYLQSSVPLKPLYYFDIPKIDTHKLSIQTQPFAGLTVLEQQALSVTVADITRLTFNLSTARINQPILSNRAFVQATHQTVTMGNTYTYTNRTQREYEATGTSDIRIAPALFNLRCSLSAAAGSSDVSASRVSSLDPQPIQQSTSIRFGCPPNRHIRVRAANCDDYRALVASGQAGLAYERTLTSAQLESLETDYSTQLYGCQERVFHQTTGFRPIVDLYDGDTFIEEMTGNYVFWEVNGRDFNVDETADSAGCKVQPQTWAEMEARTGLPKSSAWTPSNYHSCFDTVTPRGQAFESSTDYQIFNASFNNILWLPTMPDGQFLFRLRVIDSEYSYCNLETRFALDVFGAPLDTNTSLLIVGVTTAVLCVAIILTYFHYRAQVRLKKIA